jgi:hypothetical protein
MSHGKTEKSCDGPQQYCRNRADFLRIAAFISQNFNFISFPSELTMAAASCPTKILMYLVE